MNYDEFLSNKRIHDVDTGFNPDIKNAMLFDFQRDIVTWACRRGRASIFADCGLGKSPCQLVWAEMVAQHENKPVLILAPLAVSKQTKREGEKFGVGVTICESMADVKQGVNITNYQKLHRFDPSGFSGVVLDESSIIKAFTGKIRNQIIDSFSKTKFKLACTATPAPNDFVELGNHSEFMGALTRSEMLSMFFINDTSDVGTWRLKGHAMDKFWEWVCSWAVMIRKPSDLGYDDSRFVLPELSIIPHIVDSECDPFEHGMLFLTEASTLSERRIARKDSTEKRVETAADLANGTDDQWIMWCDMNHESELLSKAVRGAIEVTGSMPDHDKESAMLDFAAGKIRVLVTKPSIAGYGMNWQNCHNMAFVGLSDSYEKFYQAVRRCWRFGQDHPVNAHIIYSDLEGAVVANVRRKEQDAVKMAEGMVRFMAGISRREIKGQTNNQIKYEARKSMTIPGWLEVA